MPQQSFDCYDIFTQLYKKIQTRTTCTGLYTYHGGDGGNRTRVRKVLALTFSERSRCFESPLPCRPSTGYTARQLLMCDGTRSAFPFTFTSVRRPLRSRGAPRRNEQLTLLKQLYFCQLFLVCGLYGGSAPPLAYQGSRSPSKPLHPHILRSCPLRSYLIFILFPVPSWLAQCRAWQCALPYPRACHRAFCRGTDLPASLPCCP